MNNSEAIYTFQDHPIIPYASGEYLRDIPHRVRDRIIEKVTRYGQMIRLEGGTDTIPNWRLKQLILTWGSGIFAPHEGKLYFLQANLGGDPRPDYLPGRVEFSNPYIPWSGHLEWGKNCVLVKNDSGMQGILPIITRSSILQTHAEITMLMSMVNSRAMMIGVAGRDAEAESIKRVMSALERGEYDAIVDNNIMNQIKMQPWGAQAAGQMNDIIELLQYVKASEANDLGLQANWNGKRESLTSSETLLNDDMTHPFADDMKECWQEWVDEVNENYGEYLVEPYRVSWGSAWETNEEQAEAELAATEAEAAPEETAKGDEVNGDAD